MWTSPTDLLSAAAALLAVLALILLAARLARARGWGTIPAGRLLAIEETLPLDGRQRLLLVRCGTRRALILTGGATDLLLGWLEDAP